MDKMKYFVKLFACIPPNYGGVTVYSKRLALSLCKRGYPSGAFYSKDLQGVPSEYACLFNKMVNHARSLYILPEFLRLYRICKPYRLIHTHLSLTTIFGMWLIHKLQNKPLIITIHNEMIDKELGSLNVIDRFCVRSLFNDKKTQIICVNNNAKTLLEKSIKDIQNPIKVIPAYIKPVEIGQTSDYLSESLIRYLSEHKRYFVFYAESFAYYNGTEIYGTKACIDAFVTIHADFPDLALIFCMPNLNDEDQLNRLKETIIHHNLEQYVYWQIGPLNEMWPVLKNAALYFRPTSTDGDSVLLREALGMGVPSLASDVVKRPENCQTYQFGNDMSIVTHLKRMLVSNERPTLSNKDYFDDILEVYLKLLES
jgi:glycosyltransferase involved in cell wall biosynthesis